MAWRMLAAMPEGKAIMLGIAGGFGVTTGRCFFFPSVVVVGYISAVSWFPRTRLHANQKSLSTKPHRT